MVNIKESGSGYRIWSKIKLHFILKMNFSDILPMLFLDVKENAKVKLK